MEILTDYNWPGNVRELANVIEHAVVFCKKKEIIPECLPEDINQPGEKQKITLTLHSKSLPLAEETLIQTVLKEKNWNLQQTAKALNIARNTLYSKIKKHKIVKAN